MRFLWKLISNIAVNGCSLKTARRLFFMKKVLLPVDGTPRSMKAAELVKKLYSADECEVYVVTVREDYEAMLEKDYNMAKVDRESMPIINKAASILEGYKIKKEVLVGKSASEEIIHYAENIKAHAIVMTKSTKTAFKRVLGSVTSSVVKNAPCIVMIVPEKDF
jgi:nucleotide-binding universal stress UspA family protein